MDLGFDVCALAGASIIMLLFLLVGAIQAGKFNAVYLLDALSGAIGGALLVPGLADIPVTDPCWERFVAGLILALGVKLGVRTLVGKPMQKAMSNGRH